MLPLKNTGISVFLLVLIVQRFVNVCDMEGVFQIINISQLAYWFKLQPQWAFFLTRQSHNTAYLMMFLSVACNVQFLGTVEMESLTGPSAVGEATTRIMNSKEKPKRVVVHFKVSLKGVTITDNQRK